MFIISRILQLGVLILTATVPCISQTTDPLRITNTTFVAVPQATFFSYLLNGTGGRTPYAFSIQSGTLPLGLSLNQSGLITGVAGLVGDFFSTLQITDADGRTANAAFQFRVVQPPTIVTETLGTARVATPYLQTLRGNGGFLPLFGNYAWTLVSGSLPPGLNLTISGEILGTPIPPPGTYNFSVRMSDASNNFAQKAFVLRVDGPTIITERIQSGQLNRLYTQGLVAIGGFGAYTWQVRSGPIPPGISLTETGVLTGTPFVPGIYTFTIRVVDAAGSYFDRTYTLPVDTVSSNLSITTDTLADASVGVFYTQIIQVTGGREPYTFTISSGSLPPGMTLSINGGLSGTPTLDGAFAFAVAVADGSGLQTSRNFTLNIRTNILIIRTDLARASVGNSYSQQLVVQGGTAPYIWTPFGGPLPPGLVLNESTGIVSGIPSVAGEYTFAVRVTDSRGRTAQASYQLTIAGAVPIFSETGLLNGASFKGGAIAPGEILNIFGIGFGMGELTGIQIQNGVALTQLASTRVFFDEVAAPLLFSTLNQVGLVVPYEVINRGSVNVVLEYKGARSAPVRVAVGSAAPGIFTIDSTGKGQAAALNSDGRLNSNLNPAKPGSIIVLYATGEGQTGPFGVSGKLAFDYYPKPQLPVSVTINGQAAEVIYAGAAPNLIAGFMQVNVLIPETISTIGNVPVVITVGDASSQEQVTISVAP